MNGMEEVHRRADRYSRMFLDDLGFESSKSGRKRVKKAWSRLGGAEWDALLNEALELQRKLKEAVADHGQEKRRPEDAKALRRLYEIHGAIGIMKPSTVRRNLLKLEKEAI